ncbi:MAG: hypothetical protein KIS78_37185 [Labilithrix sp.]|nr:hypothetical protein [Labilithrix sp.]MCW5838085.1 hypothetical protein [Labilithrix sp.]
MSRVFAAGPRAPLPWHGAAALACWMIHGGNHVLRGTAHDLLWACNVAVPVLALGCFRGARTACAIPLLWLSFGTPIWLIDLATGAGLIPTSLFVHVIAPLIGIAAVRRLGWPPRAWLSATMASAGLLLLTRLVGAPEPNVNLAFRIHDGWERAFGSHALFLATLLGASAVVFVAVDAGARRLARRRP